MKYGDGYTLSIDWMIRLFIYYLDTPLLDVFLGRIDQYKLIWMHWYSHVVLFDKISYFPQTRREMIRPIKGILGLGVTEEEEERWMIKYPNQDVRSTMMKKILVITTIATTIPTLNFEWEANGTIPDPMRKNINPCSLLNWSIFCKSSMFFSTVVISFWG